MSIKLTQTYNELTLVSFPMYLIMLLLAFLLTFLISSLTGDNEIKVVDHIIFITVIGIGVVIQKRKTLTLNKESNTGKLLVQTIINKTENNFYLSDVKKVEMSFGRGQYARGGTICMHIANIERPLVIADSDVAGNSEKHNTSATNVISKWLKLTFTA
jgi:hypothetical protein